MGLYQAVVVVLTFGLASGQLVLQPLDDSHAFSVAPHVHDEEIRKESVAQRIVNPTICDPQVQQHAGYLEVVPGTQYFFWMLESRSDPKNDPLVLWLTGGPGCSSQLALLAENGPCTVDENGKTQNNSYSWTNQANVVWVDQPAATGFSTGSATEKGDEQVVAEMMYKFMLAFYKALPQYQRNPLFVFGESYAGHFIPAISHYFLQQGQDNGADLPLKGIGIGNGLTNPQVQYNWYPQMAYDGGKSEGGSLEESVVDNETFTIMQDAVEECVAYISQCNEGSNDGDCGWAYTFCNFFELAPYMNTGYNPYDMRKECEVRPLCYNFSAVDAFLNNKETQMQLGVNMTWDSCNFHVNRAFTSKDWMTGVQTKIPSLLAAGLQVLIYAGDVDFICNWLGNKKWALALDWPHKDDFNGAEDVPYEVAGKVAGRLRSSHGFHFLQVYQAGHMVPMDKPEVALHMFNNFIHRNMSEAAARNARILYP